MCTQLVKKIVKLKLNGAFTRSSYHSNFNSDKLTPKIRLQEARFPYGSGRPNLRVASCSHIPQRSILSTLADIIRMTLHFFYTVKQSWWMICDIGIPVDQMLRSVYTLSKCVVFWFQSGSLRTNIFSPKARQWMNSWKGGMFIETTKYIRLSACTFRNGLNWNLQAHSSFAHWHIKYYFVKIVTWLFAATKSPAVLYILIYRMKGNRRF